MHIEQSKMRQESITDRVNLSSSKVWIKGNLNALQVHDQLRTALTAALLLCFDNKYEVRT